MTDDEQDSDRRTDARYTEASASMFDHPNVNKMDEAFMVTMNNEHVKRGYIPSADIERVKAQIGVMGALEKLFAGGYYDVDTARAIEAGRFTLERAVESARDGFFTRMEHSQYNYETMLAPSQKKGFLGGLFGKKQEPQMYQGQGRQ